MSNETTFREKWLKAGMALFSEGGIRNIQVEKIASRLGYSSSEFYHFFKDEGDFLNQMLRYWHEHKTSRVVENFNREPIDKRLEKLVDTVFADQSMPNFLFYLRNLAKEDKRIARFIAEVEEKRIIPTRSIFNGLGLGQKEIDLKVEILYSFYLGWKERYKYEKFSPELREQVLDQLYHLLGLNKEEH